MLIFFHISHNVDVLLPLCHSSQLHIYERWVRFDVYRSHDVLKTRRIYFQRVRPPAETYIAKRPAPSVWTIHVLPVRGSLRVTGTAGTT